MHVHSEMREHLLLLVVRYLDEKVTEVDVSENVQGGKAEERKERNGSNAIALLQHPVLTT